MVGLIEDSKKQKDIEATSGQDADGIKRVGIRHDAVAGDEAVGRFEADISTPLDQTRWRR